MAQRGGILEEMAERDAQYAHFSAKQGFFTIRKITTSIYVIMMRISLFPQQRKNLTH